MASLGKFGSVTALLHVQVTRDNLTNDVCFTANWGRLP